jgi:integrase
LFKDFADGFMKTYSAMNHKASTSDSYRTVLDTHILPRFGDIPLDRIAKKEVKEFLTEKLQSGLALNTVRNIKRYFSTIMAEAVDDEIIAVNPVLKTGKILKKKREESEGINPFNWEEKSIFEGAMKEHFPRYYPLFLTSLRNGMRIGEILALQPGDLDFNGRFIEIRRTFTKGELTTPKSGKTRRVDMSIGLAKVLKFYLADRKKETLKKGWGEPPEWLFYNEKGRALDVDNLRKRIFYKCLEKAGLKQIRQHDLRHTYATLRIMKGDNILDVSKQLGHYSPKLTLGIYTYWMPGTKKAEIDELDLANEPDRNSASSGNKEPDKDVEDVQRCRAYIFFTLTCTLFTPKGQNKEK